MKAGIDARAVLDHQIIAHNNSGDWSEEQT
jgi:hypothetical protein